MTSVAPAIEQHASDSFALLRTSIAEAAATYRPHDALSAAVHLWAMTLITLAHERGRAIESLCLHGHGRAASVAMRALTEYAVKLPFILDDPVKALRVVIAEPITDRMKAKGHMQTLPPGAESRMQDDLAIARPLYVSVRPELNGASDAVIDDAMRGEKFPDMAQLIQKYLGNSEEYVTRYMWQSGIEHGSGTGVRHAIREVKGDGSIVPVLDATDGQENRHLWVAVGYALAIIRGLDSKYNLGQTLQVGDLETNHLLLQQKELSLKQT